MLDEDGDINKKPIRLMSLKLRNQTIIQVSIFSQACVMAPGRLVSP